MINSFLYATKLRKYLHCPAGGLPRPRRGGRPASRPLVALLYYSSSHPRTTSIPPDDYGDNSPRLWIFSRSTATIPLSTHVDLSSTYLTPIIPARSPNIYVRGRRKSPTAPRLFFVSKGVFSLLLPFGISSGSHTAETEGSSYLCRVQGYV